MSDQEDEMDARFCEWLAQFFYKNWPWHFNARRHYYILETQRRILECDSDWARGRFELQLDKFMQGDPEEMLDRDRSMCCGLIRIDRYAPNHPLIEKLQVIKSRSVCGYVDRYNAAHELAIEIQENEPIFPNYGVYIYYHPYEGYKIGQAENIVRRMAKHACSAPSSELLHVIETPDMDWCEGFLHNKFQRQRKFANHEYFDLSYRDLHWLFSIAFLERPKSIANQLSLLDLL